MDGFNLKKNKKCADGWMEKMEWMEKMNGMNGQNEWNEWNELKNEWNG